MQFLPVGLFLLFLFLKITDKIDWSWFWVASPLWISGVLVVLVVIIWAIAALIGFKGATKIGRK